MFSKLRLENQEKKTVYLCLNKSLSFSTVDVQQNVKCLYSQLRVLCVRWITAHLRLKPTLSLSLVILSKHKKPYVGTNVLSSSVAMDKIMTKHILEVAGVPQVAYTVFIEGEDLEAAVAETLEKLTFPVFVKPANMGSSVGISKAENEAELRAAIDLALKYDSRILIEQGVVAREIEVGILGNTTVKTTDPGEVVKDVAFYDYQAKYIDNKITMDIPAHVPAEVMTQMRAYAAKAFRALGGCGLARCDFFLTEDGAIYLNELNTMPGFTQWSMYPLLWENMGLSYSDLIKELVALGQEMFDKRESHLI